MDTLVIYGLFFIRSRGSDLRGAGKTLMNNGLTQLKQDSSGCFPLFFQHHSLDDFREVGKTKDVPQACCITFPTPLARLLQD